MQPFDSLDEEKAAPRVKRDAGRPKDAATLIVVRRDGPEPRILMGRRAAGHAFMASKWVFPGGRLDRADFTAPSATELSPEVAAAVERGAPARRTRALGLAAIRETFEETGLLLARAAPPRPATGPWREFLGSGALPDLSALSYVARAITPPGRSRRFDARFFLAHADNLLSLEPAASSELDEVAWIELSRTDELDPPQITRFVLAELEQRLQHPDRPIPLVHMVRGRHVIAHA